MISPNQITTSCIGIDPDLHCITMAHVQPKGLILQSIKVPKAIIGLDTIPFVIKCFRELSKTVHNTEPIKVFVEGQSMVQAKNTKVRKQDIVVLANMAGAICGCAGVLFNTDPIIVLPRDWKGTLPKHVFQKRICLRMGWDYTMAGGKSPYCVPTMRSDYPVESWIFLKGKNVEKMINTGDWKHTLDSIGLSLYGANK